jgi:hypothetical protein
METRSNANSTYLLIIVAILVVAGFTIFKLIQTNKDLHSHIPNLLQDETIKYFDLLDKDGRELDISALNTQNPVLLFVFSRPCTKCNKNIIFWQKLTEIAQNKVDVYGIVLDDLGKAFEFEEEAKLNFKIYVPENIKKFEKNLRIKLNFSQTIVYSNGVKYLKMGNLQGEETVKIIKLLRNLKKENERE